MLRGPQQHFRIGRSHAMQGAHGLVPCSTHSMRITHVAQAASNSGGGGFAGDFMKLVKKVQGSLPIIGLVSRLAAPEGGFDSETAYPEYCRSTYDKAPPSMTAAMKELQKKHGKMAASRWVLLLLWMTTTGLGLVTGQEIIAAARRLRVTQDVEFEIDRFELARTAARKKYEMIAPPTPKAAEQAVVAMDALCTLCLGLKDGEAVSEQDARYLVDIVTAAMPAVPAELVASIAAERSKRAAAYA